MPKTPHPSSASTSTASVPGSASARRSGRSKPPSHPPKRSNSSISGAGVARDKSQSMGSEPADDTMIGDSDSATSKSIDPSNPYPWRHPDELAYVCRNDWGQELMVEYLCQKSFSIPPRDPQSPIFHVITCDGKSVPLPSRYRVPLIFVTKFQWDSLKLVLTSVNPTKEWEDFKFDIVHLSRLCQHLFDEADKAQKLAMANTGKNIDRSWRSKMFDRVLTRFYHRWFVSREWSIRKFWEEFDEEEYANDVLKYDWVRWAYKGHKGFMLTKEEVFNGKTAEQFMHGLEKNDQGRWVWNVDSPSALSMPPSASPVPPITPTTASQPFKFSTAPAPPPSASSILTSAAVSTSPPAPAPMDVDSLTFTEKPKTLMLAKNGEVLNMEAVNITPSYNTLEVKQEQLELSEKLSGVDGLTLRAEKISTPSVTRGTPAFSPLIAPASPVSQPPPVQSPPSVSSASPTSAPTAVLGPVTDPPSGPLSKTNTKTSATSTTVAAKTVKTPQSPVAGQKRARDADEELVTAKKRQTEIDGLPVYDRPQMKRLMTTKVSSRFVRKIPSKEENDFSRISISCDCSDSEEDDPKQDADYTTLGRSKKETPTTSSVAGTTSVTVKVSPPSPTTTAKSIDASSRTEAIVSAMPIAAEPELSLSPGAPPSKSPADKLSETPISPQATHDAASSTLRKVILRLPNPNPPSSSFPALAVAFPPIPASSASILTRVTAPALALEAPKKSDTSSLPISSKLASRPTSNVNHQIVELPVPTSTSTQPKVSPTTTSVSSTTSGLISRSKSVVTPGTTSQETHLKSTPSALEITAVAGDTIAPKVTSPITAEPSLSSGAPLIPLVSSAQGTHPSPSSDSQPPAAPLNAASSNQSQTASISAAITPGTSAAVHDENETPVFVAPVLSKPAVAPVPGAIDNNLATTTMAAIVVEGQNVVVGPNQFSTETTPHPSPRTPAASASSDMMDIDKSSESDNHPEFGETGLRRLLSHRNRTRVLYSLILSLDILHFAHDSSSAPNQKSSVSQRLEEAKNRVLASSSFRPAVQKRYTLPGGEEDMSAGLRFRLFVEVATVVSSYLLPYIGTELETEIEKLEARLRDELVKLGAIEVKVEEKTIKEAAIQVEPRPRIFVDQGAATVVEVPTSRHVQVMTMEKRMVTESTQTEIEAERVQDLPPTSMDLDLPSRGRVQPLTPDATMVDLVSLQSPSPRPSSSEVFKTETSLVMRDGMPSAARIMTSMMRNMADLLECASGGDVKGKGREVDVPFFGAGNMGSAYDSPIITALLGEFKSMKEELRIGQQRSREEIDYYRAEIESVKEDMTAREVRYREDADVERQRHRRELETLKKTNREIEKDREKTAEDDETRMPALELLELRKRIAFLEGQARSGGMSPVSTSHGGLELGDGMDVTITRRNHHPLGHLIGSEDGFSRSTPAPPRSMTDGAASASKPGTPIQQPPAQLEKERTTAMEIVEPIPLPIKSQRKFQVVHRASLG